VHASLTPSTVQVAAYRRRLPLNTILRLVQVLAAPVEKICAETYDL
jgi:hypothetical protein